MNALSELCGIYWRPLYLFLRREGHSAEDAQDLTQGFFADLIAKEPQLLDDDALEGRAIKCISMLLPKMPRKHNYKV